MKKIITTLATILTLATGSAAFATTPYQYNFSVTPDIGGVYNQTIDAPSDNTNCYLFGIDPTNHTPRLIQPNSGLTCDGSVVNVDNIDQTHVTGLTTSFSNIATMFATENLNIANATSTLATLVTQSNLNLLYITAIANNLSGASTTMMVSSGLPGFMYATDKAKLDSLSTTTVQANYTQASTTASDYIKNKPALGISYEGTTQRVNSFPIFKSATVASGVAVFNLTADGTSGGTALCTNGVIQDSVNAFVSDATASYQMSYAFTNSNKTVTVTTNKLTTANILSGILGQSAANSSVVKLSVWCY